MIDVHVHVTNARLPGIKAESPALGGPSEPLASAFLGGMKASGIEQTPICPTIPWTPAFGPSPMRIESNSPRMRVAI